MYWHCFQVFSWIIGKKYFAWEILSKFSVHWTVFELSAHVDKQNAELLRKTGLYLWAKQTNFVLDNDIYSEKGKRSFTNKRAIYIENIQKKEPNKITIYRANICSYSDCFRFIRAQDTLLKVDELTFSYFNILSVDLGSWCFGVASDDNHGLCLLSPGLTLE